MAANSIVSRRARAFAVTVLMALALASPVAAQKTYRFYESGAPQPMAVAPSEIALKAAPQAS